jgi:hypothetical protein
VKQETQARIKSAANIKVLFMNATFAADEKTGALPLHWSDIFMTDEYHDWKVFLSPRSKTQPPSSDIVKDNQKLGQWIDKNSDYVWIGAGAVLKNVPKDRLIAYESPSRVINQDGINVVYANGKVEFVAMDEAKELIASSTATTRPSR